ncbi:MAG TPA: alpha-ketoacid dehydrogenase subunit beta [Chloroflexota bacterium]|nr:alpha-ketoacid dehydrogenase subunit beta [Chloroflexota bacterium]
MSGTFLQGVNQALADAMREDQSVYVLGEDVAVGGPYGATKGLAEEFGENRVINTPISEGTVVGLAIGAALQGLRPVVEIMFVDFITLAMDQLVNHAAKLRYMSGGQLKVPLTIRTACGVSGAWGAHHSQSLEAWLAHVPGLKVVMPSTAADAEGLLRAAIRDDNPVVFVEHRALYYQAGGEPPDTPELGKARVRRAGRDVTVIATGRMVGLALEAAGELAKDGVEAEVIDPRTLQPLDVPALAESVRKTNRAVVVHEAVVPGGIGAEIAAQLQAVAFDYLDAPIERVGAPFAPVPAGPSLEAAYLPDAAAIVGAAKRTLTRG